MVRSVFSVDHTTTRAGLACVARIDGHQRDARKLCLVGKKGTKLAKCPGVQARSLTAPGRNPPAYARQFFQGNAATGAFGSLHDHLRYHVVGMLTESGLPSSEFAQPALGCLSTSFLKSALSPCEFVTDSLDIGTGMNRSIAVNGKRDYAEVNAKPVCCLKLVGFWNVTDHGKQPFSSYKAEINLALAVGHQTPLVIPHHDRDSHTPIYGPQIDRAAILKETDYSVVVGLGGVLAKDWGNLAADLECARDLRDRSHSGLRSKAKPLTHSVVSHLVQIVLPERVGLEASSSEPCACLVAARQSCPKARGLLARRQHFESGDQLHTIKYRWFRPC